MPVTNVTLQRGTDYQLGILCSIFGHCVGLFVAITPDNSPCGGHHRQPCARFGQRPHLNGQASQANGVACVLSQPDQASAEGIIDNLVTACFGREC